MNHNKLDLIADERQRILIELKENYSLGTAVITEKGTFYHEAYIAAIVNCENEETKRENVFGPVSKLYSAAMREAIEHVKMDYFYAGRDNPGLSLEEFEKQERIKDAKMLREKLNYEP